MSPEGGDAAPAGAGRDQAPGGTTGTAGGASRGGPIPAGSPPPGSSGRGRRVELLSAACFGASMAAAVALAVVYWRGGQVQAEGVLLAVTLGGIGVGIVVWAKEFIPSEEVAEDRHPMASTEEAVAAFTETFEAGESSLRRRRLLVAMGGGALVALGAALLFPIRSLGPRPGRGLKRTAYAGGGKRVVRRDGTPVKPTDLDQGGAITVWPEGDVGAPDSPTLLIRVDEGQQFELPSDRASGVIDDQVVAYSKLCTHVGCPVGLYQAGLALLLCPCHQSTFNVLEGARPVFGPAARPLPQLPLAVDDAGFIVATGDFSGPVGPGFWDRDR